MTAQFGENLRYLEEEVKMFTNPLYTYFVLGGLNSPFKSNCSALWRGYVGCWDIVDDRLYLVKLDGTFANGTEACLADIFPDFPERVFAHWYSGELRIPRGERLKYVHGGYRSIYERDLLLRIERGVVKVVRVRHNSIPEPEKSPEKNRRYFIPAFLRFKTDGRRRS